MRDDEEARAAMFSTSQSLSRAQLDAGISREVFWGVIERRFNDISIRPRLSLIGIVDGVDSAALPLCFRGAAVLKHQFFSVRAGFTESTERWKASGQNDPNRFTNFLAKTSRGELTSQSKRLFILFTCCRMGSRYGAVDSLLVQISSKTISDERVVHEEGIKDQECDWTEDASERVTRSTGPRKWRSYTQRDREGDLERKSIAVP